MLLVPQKCEIKMVLSVKKNCSFFNIVIGLSSIIPCNVITFILLAFWYNFFVSLLFFSFSSCHFFLLVKAIAINLFLILAATIFLSIVSTTHQPYPTYDHTQFQMQVFMRSYFISNKSIEFLLFKINIYRSYNICTVD